jgi:hypothetical protein
VALIKTVLIASSLVGALQARHVQDTLSLWFRGRLIAAKEITLWLIVLFDYSGPPKVPPLRLFMDVFYKFVLDFS